MRVSFRLLLSLIFISLLLGCDNGELDFNNRNSEFDPTTRSWDFSQASDYSYNANYVEISGGQANLKVVDQSFSGSDFSAGIHVGTYLNSNNNLSLRNQQKANSLDVNFIFPTKAGSLVGYWRMDGDYLDSSGNNLHGVVTNAGFSSATRFGSQAASFDGTGDYISIPSDPTVGLSTLTISVWSKITLQGHSNTLLGSYGGGPNTSILIYTSSLGEVFMEMDTDTSPPIGIVGAGKIIEDDTWHHVVVTYDGVTAKLFVDGSEVGATATTGLINNPALNFEIGRYASNDATTPLGEIDEVAIWSSALTSNEVQFLYENQNVNFTELSSLWTPQFSNIKGYWKMDGNWRDSSSNSKHGSIGAGDPDFSNTSRVGSQSGQFDGGGDYISTTGDILGDSYTKSAWIYLEGAQAFNTIVGNGPGSAHVFWVPQAGCGGNYRLSSGHNGSWCLVADSEDFNFNQWVYVAVTYDSVSQIMKLYKNGRRIDTATVVPGPALKTVSIGAFAAGTSLLEGKIDELAIWDVALSESEITLIHQRQKQKYAGHYDSPVINIGAAGSWTDLKAVTSLPFYKELLTSSETSVNYSDLTVDFSIDLIGYWPLNERVANSIGGSDFEDRSSSGFNGNESGGVLFGKVGLIGEASDFDGSDDLVDLGTPALLESITAFSVSTWINPDRVATAGQFPHIVAQRDLATMRWALGLEGNQSGKLIGTVVTSGVSADTTVNFTPVPGEWTHVVMTYDDGGDRKVKIYINGEIATSFFANTTATGVIQSGVGVETVFGNRFGGGRGFDGRIDDVALWSKEISGSEALELYRRGANRIKYQVKSCVDPSCYCKTFSTSPVGSAFDCDGDGTPNSSDTSDLYLSEFTGPGGSDQTYFSELFSRASGNMNFSCALNTTDTDNNVCVDDEITLSGDSLSSSAQLTFVDFPATAQPANQIYFQYRVYMESDENSLCSNTVCMPEIESIEVGPTGRYYGGEFEIVSLTPLSFFFSLENFSIENSGSCLVNFQLSVDGTNFYYWDGSLWSTASISSQSNDAGTVALRIAAFSQQIGFGSVYFKAILSGSNFNTCDLSQILVTELP